MYTGEGKKNRISIYSICLSITSMIHQSVLGQKYRLDAKVFRFYLPSMSELDQDRDMEEDIGCLMSSKVGCAP